MMPSTMSSSVQHGSVPQINDPVTLPTTDSQVQFTSLDDDEAKLGRVPHDYGMMWDIDRKMSIERTM